MKNINFVKGQRKGKGFEADHLLYKHILGSLGIPGGAVSVLEAYPLL